MAKIGRPAVITPELIKQVFELVSQGESERSVFDREEMPSWNCWCVYKRNQFANEEFNYQYTRAKEECMKVWEQRIIAISHDESRDLIPDGKGSYKSDNTAVNRDRLKVDSLKWIMSKLAPKVYGEKNQTELSGPDGGAIPVIQVGIKENNTKS